MLVFEYIWVFIILPLPLLVWLLVSSARRQQMALWVPFFDDWQRLQGEDVSSTRMRKGVLALLIVGWLSLLLAAARPTWLGKPVSQAISGREMLLENGFDGRQGDHFTAKLDKSFQSSAKGQASPGHREYGEQSRRFACLFAKWRLFHPVSA